VRVRGRYACDNWEVLREWALAGLGMALKSTWDVYRQLQDGSLIALFPGYSFHSEVAIYAVYPHRRFLPAKTRVFIEFLAQSFGPEPYWDFPAPRAKPRIRPRAAA
jgi:DNA-binding transcriptional LysR family regulator